MGLRPTNVRYVVLFGLCLAAALAYVHRGCLSIVESTARSDLGLSPREMGWAIGAFFWAYALFQIPTGLLVDRWGPRRALTLFGLLGAVTLALSAGTLWVDAATGFAILLVARVLMGIAQAGLFPASTRALSVWIPIRRRAFAAGMLQACMSLGGAVGAFITAQLLGVVYWPWVFVIYAVPGLVWSAWFFAWFRDDPNEHQAANDAERALLFTEPVVPASGPGTGSIAVLVSFPVVCLCAQQVFRAGANVFWFTWCPTYFQNTYGLSAAKPARSPVCRSFASSSDASLGGWIADHVLVGTGSRRLSRSGTAIVASGLGAALFGLTFLVPRDAGDPGCLHSRRWPQLWCPVATPAGTARRWTWAGETWRPSSGP